MKKPRSESSRLTCLMAGLFCFCSAFAGGEPLPTLWIIGDSTVKNSTKDQRGWGSALPGHFDDSKIKVENHARGGRSSRSYLTEGLWDAVAGQIKKGDFVLIQFGHNDGGGNYFDEKGRASIHGTGDETEKDSRINPLSPPCTMLSTTSPKKQIPSSNMGGACCGTS